jgi:hypothetical protein
MAQDQEETVTSKGIITIMKIECPHHQTSMSRKEDIPLISSEETMIMITLIEEEEGMVVQEISLIDQKDLTQEETMAIQ